MRDLFKHIIDISDFKKQQLLTILGCFLGSYLVVRIYSLVYGHSIFIEGYQIHHFYFGTLFLVIGGILGLMTDVRRFRRFASVLIGVGIGLFADELGLLLNCTTHDHLCAYVFPDQYDFVGYISAVIVILIILLTLYNRRQSNKDVL